MQVKFGNDKVVPYDMAIETEEYYNGSSRRTITFDCPAANLSVDEVNRILSVEGNVESLRLVDDAGVTQNTYDGYVIKMECGFVTKEIARETSDAPAQYAEVLRFKLGKRTYIESMLAAQGIRM